MRALELFFAKASDPESVPSQNYPNFHNLLTMLDENVFVALDRPESIKLHENYKEDIGQGFSSEKTVPFRDNRSAETCLPQCVRPFFTLF